MKDEYLESLLNLIKSKKNENPKMSYTAFLHQKGLNEILGKIAEESEETINAAKSEGDDQLVHEIADLWFHCLVLLSQKNLTVDDITNELKRREGTSGIEEKHNRVKK
ncbi:phosphoribosyl-ATP diphosphatase [Methylophilaceae bacterium]|nr:phosphoribosyl-ATP diphosphatase [Methylophilaceae bacterium]|tara:strand:- start:4199 stop:4522 length:324 start_codon:yes stop_codon:yes gene_type:complete